MYFKFSSCAQELQRTMIMRNEGKHLLLLITFPLCLSSARFAHLKLAMKIVSENKSMRKLGMSAILKS